MSDNKQQLSPEEIKEQLREEVRADLEKEFHQKIDSLNKELAAAKKAEPSKAIEGKVELSLEDADGKNKKVTVGIADGFPTIRPLRGQPLIIDSEVFLALAAGKKVDEQVKKDLAAKGCTQEVAKARLQELVEIDSSMIKIITK